VEEPELEIPESAALPAPSSPEPSTSAGPSPPEQPTRQCRNSDGSVLRSQLTRQENGSVSETSDRGLPEDDDPDDGDEAALARRVKEERMLEEDIELVSGNTSPVPEPTWKQTAAQTMQAASEAAASTLLASCGAPESLPWKDPRWEKLLPEEKISEAMGNMLDVPTLAAKLMKNLFTEDERIHSNTTGDHGKQIFDKEKMDFIRSIVFHVSKVSEEDQYARDDLWVRCKMKIDKWNRDLRYARKKKDKDTSLPTMVKLEGAAAAAGVSGGRDDEEDEPLSLTCPPSMLRMDEPGPSWLERRHSLSSSAGGYSQQLQQPQCSADV